MNGFVVFFAVIAVAAAGSVGRSTNNGGWGSVPPPSLNLNVNGDLAAAAEGAADASQSSDALVLGTYINPAQYSGAAGTSGGVYQEGILSQQLSGSPNGPSGQTYGTASVVNGAAGAEGAALEGSGGQLVAIQNLGNSNASGTGVAAASEQSQNNVVSP